jgi:DNA-binding CsgD family transcriptional regulator
MISEKVNPPSLADKAALKPTIMLALVEAMLADFPLGLLVINATGRVLWSNREAEIACSMWNRRPKGVDALPLERDGSAVPAPLWAACVSLRAAEGSARQVEIVCDHDRGLLARIHSREFEGERWFFVRMDYRRPRSDRERAMSVEAVALLAQLTPREREVALRVRDGLRTTQIAAALCRSPLTIKSQLASVYRRLGITSRTRLAAILNR